jgi:molybdenum cofactor cytidylyltransferase
MSETSQHIHAFILAAGASRRFDGIKLLAPIPSIQNKPHKPQSIIEHCVTQVHQAQFDSYSVILGANAEAIEAALQVKKQQWGFATHINPSWQQGMGVTIATAVGLATSSHIVICAADQIAIKSEHFSRLIAASHKHPTCIIAAKYSGRLGVPCIFPRAYFEELARLTGDKGAKDLIANEKHNVISIEIPEGAHDVDTPNDLMRLI